MKYWFFLIFAIMTEVTGTLSMKYASVSGDLSGHVVMYLMITVSYLLLSVAVKRIALGVAYALWEGVGLVLITLGSVLAFEEAIGPMKLAGLVVLVAGIYLIKSGSFMPEKGHDQEEGDHAIL